jgi:5-methylcytosine-specific restriction endonuclease McrA
VKSVPCEFSQISELARAKHERRRLRDRKRRLLGRGRLLEWLGKACPYCGLLMSDRDGSQGWRAPSRDHRVPGSRGGRNVVENIEIVCRRCNQQKGELTPEEFRHRQSRHRHHLRSTPQTRSVAAAISSSFHERHAKVCGLFRMLGMRWSHIDRVDIIQRDPSMLNEHLQ